MKGINLLAVLLVVGPTTMRAQDGFSSSFSLDDQPTIRVESRVDPSKPYPSGIRSGSAHHNKQYERFLYNTAGHEYQGYSLTLDSVGSREYRVTLGPLDISPAEKPINDPSARLLPNPEFPPPQVLHFGERMEFVFFENAKTGQKVIDTIWLEPHVCDGSPNCVADLQDDLELRLQRLREKHLAQANLLEDWERSWEAYRDGVCGSLGDATKQTNCKFEMTRERISALAQQLRY